MDYNDTHAGESSPIIILLEIKYLLINIMDGAIEYRFLKRFQDKRSLRLEK